MDNREVLNCYYAHADQADQLQVSPKPCAGALAIGPSSIHNQTTDFRLRSPRTTGTFDSAFTPAIASATVPGRVQRPRTGARARHTVFVVLGRGVYAVCGAAPQQARQHEVTSFVVSRGSGMRMRGFVLCASSPDLLAGACQCCLLAVARCQRTPGGPRSAWLPQCSDAATGCCTATTAWCWCTTFRV